MIVILYMRMWIEIDNVCGTECEVIVILYMRMWIEMQSLTHAANLLESSSIWGCELKYVTPTMRKIVKESSSIWGCELKYPSCYIICNRQKVILYMRMWIEIGKPLGLTRANIVILYMRMWIEIFQFCKRKIRMPVILYMRMWIEILLDNQPSDLHRCHPLYEDVNWNKHQGISDLQDFVILYMRMWIEI